VTEQPAKVQELITFALSALEPMQLKDGAFCQEVKHGDPSPIGRSIRYTAMTAIGLIRASENGHHNRLRLEEATERVMAELISPVLSVGDLGLCLWLDRRAQGTEVDRIAHVLLERLGTRSALETSEGMQLAWIAIGLGLTLCDAPTEPLRQALRDVLDQMIDRNQQPSGLICHTGRGPRRRFPNFATQIYTALALACIAKLDIDPRAARAGRLLGDALLNIQLRDGGWPWIVDAFRSRIVEPYEIYTVHQDAMAPMGLLELSEALDVDRYREAALYGLEWIFGRNDLQQDMLSSDGRMLYRSIRRKAPRERLLLYANTATAFVSRPIAPRLRGSLEINATDRPYHLGWILEAWCGREDEGQRRNSP
jgi:hypothetical protein